MITSMEELKNFKGRKGKVINGVDDPSILSVSSVDVLSTDIDELLTDEGKQSLEEKEAEKKAEEKETPDQEIKEEDKDQVSEEEGKSEEVDTKPDQEPDKVPASVQKRINTAVKKQRSAERERDYERDQRKKEVAALKAQLAALEGRVPPEGRPERDDFEDDALYFEALADWKVEQKIKNLNVQPPQKDEEPSHEDKLKKILGIGAKTYTDFDDFVYSDDLDMTHSMEEAILLSDPEVAVNILYYLGKNPKEATRLSKLDSLKISRELGKLETQLAKGAEEVDETSAESETKLETKPKPQKKLTKAPEPITPPMQTGEITKDPDKMSMAEYRKWRERNK